LLVGDVATSELAAVVAYGSLRTARRRLARMVELGLIRGFWAANNQRPRGRYAYSLVGSVRHELERGRRGGRRRRDREGPGTTTIHQLATSDLMAAFLRDAEPDDGLGLAAWLPERAVATLFDGYVEPDALAVIGTPSARICLVIERDLGTEPTATVAAKAARYATLLGGQTDPPANIGIVVESARRSASIRHAIESVDARGLHVWVATSTELLAAPYHGPWTAPDGRRCHTVDLPAEAVSETPVVGALCLLDPDAADVFEPSAIEVVPALQRFVRRR
jgi:Replication-relaxation